MAVDNHHDAQSEPDWTTLEQLSPTAEGEHLNTPARPTHPYCIKHWAGTEEPRANTGCGANLTQVLLCALILTWSVGEKTNVQNMGEKNQLGPSETGHHFSLIPPALAVLQQSESREREAGQCGWTHSDAGPAW